jgi:hypothetical protein
MAEGEEFNQFKNTLATAKNTTIPNARDAVYHGSGNPADSLLGDLSSGGWACTSATEFSNTVRGKTGEIIGAFDDAIGVVNTRWASEPEKVPKGDYRGNAWAKQWSMRNI